MGSFVEVISTFGASRAIDHIPDVALQRVVNLIRPVRLAAALFDHVTDPETYK